MNPAKTKGVFRATLLATVTKKVVTMFKKSYCRISRGGRSSGQGPDIASKTYSEC